jgi:hypothetical protein
MVLKLPLERLKIREKYALREILLLEETLG